MKKLIFMLVGLFALIASSCTNEASLQGDEPQAPEKSAIRTEEEAIQIAQNLATARHGSRAPKNVANVINIYSTLSRNNDTPLIYAINFDNNEGYTLISASKNGQDLLGYTEDGSFSENLVSEGSGFTFFLNAAKDYVSNQMTKASSFDPIVMPDKPKVETHSIISQIIVSWGQDYPERMLMPTMKGRFELTAIAQLMSYVKQPLYINLTFPTRDLDLLNLNWNELTKHSNSVSSTEDSDIIQHLNSCPATEETHKNLSRLFTEIANRFDTTSPGSNIRKNIYQIRYVLQTIWQKSGFQKFDFGDILSFSEDNVIMNQMKNKNGVALLEGFDDDNNEYIWLCDGGTLTTTTSKFTKWTGEVETIVTQKSLYHFNWGDSGKANGFYYGGVFARTDTNVNYKHNLKYFFTYPAKQE